MPLIQKIAPVGVDRDIDRINEHIFNELDWESISGVTHEANHRAYLNKIVDGNLRIPELFNPATKDYEESYFNDNVAASSFFITDDTRTGSRKYKITVSIIFQLKLEEIFPLINHRADEEAHVDVLNALEDNPTGAKIIGLVTDIDKVYEGLNVSNIKFTDMQEFHVFRVDMDLNYENC